MLLLSFLAAGALVAQSTDGIRKRDLALSRAVEYDGLRRALATALTDDAVLVYAGTPVVVGRAKVIALLSAQPVLDSLTVVWAPKDAWLSEAGDFAITVGTGTVTQDPAKPGHGMTYIAGWRRDGRRWLVAGLLLVGVGSPGKAVLPQGSGPNELPGVTPGGVTAGMAQADLDFSALAGQAGAGEAFRVFAAPDAVTYGGRGAARRGPDAISAAIGSGPPADWKWYPVAARSSAAGDLGFTVGQATIRARDGSNITLSKYLTAWARQPDGKYRYVSDGGNERPAP